MTVSNMHFRVSARLAKLLGRQSISTPVVAIFELVKNSFDADAENVSIEFKNIITGTPTIIIQDDGDGMSEPDIISKFMVIGIQNKEVKTRTRMGRRVIGQKGIGRLSMERLAHEATIISKPIGTGEMYSFSINWDKFEVPNVTFDEVGIELKRIQKDNVDDHGFAIILSRLRADEDVWNKELIQQIRDELATLILPDEFESSHPFRIKFSAPEFGIVEQELQTQLYEKAGYKVHGILKDNQIQIRILYKDQIVRGFELRNNILPEYKYVNVKPREQEIKMDCGPTEFFAYVFPPGSRKEEIKEWDEYYGTRYRDAIDTLLEKHAGVKIYRDAFRVMPYGSRGHDWIERDSAARSLSGAIPNKQLVGWVKLHSDVNTRIIDTTTREKIIENDSFEELRRFVKSCMYAVDEHAHALLVQKRVARKRNISESISVVAQHVKNSDMNEPEKKETVYQLRQIAEDADKEKEEHEREMEQLMDEIQALRNLASLGLITGMVSHEINRSLGYVFDLSRDLQNEKLLRSLNPNLRKKCWDLFQHTAYINEWITFINQFTSSLKSKNPLFRRKQRINLHDAVDFILGQLRQSFDRAKINVDPKFDANLVPNDIEVYMYKADLQSILMNLVSNSIKAIKSTHRSNDRREWNQHRIKISTASDPYNLVLMVSDDGPGVKDTMREEIFKLFVSTYDGDDEGASGSGLGLPIVREIIGEYNGTIEVGQAELGKGATFVIKIPWTSLRPTISSKKG